MRPTPTRSYGPLAAACLGVIILGTIALSKVYIDGLIADAYEDGVAYGERNALLPDEQEARCLQLWGEMQWEKQQQLEQFKQEQRMNKLHKGMF